MLYTGVGKDNLAVCASGRVTCFGLSCECFCVFLSNWTAILLHFDVGCASYCQDTGDL